MREIDGSKWLKAAGDEAANQRAWISHRIRNNDVLEGFQEGFRQGFLKALAMLEEAQVIHQNFAFPKEGSNG